MYIIAFVNIVNHIVDQAVIMNNNCVYFDTLEEAQDYLASNGFEQSSPEGFAWKQADNILSADGRPLSVTHAVILTENPYPDNPIYICQL